MRQIAFEHFLVRIAIPDFWKDEVEKNGAVACFDDRPRSGTMRLATRDYHKEGGNPDPAYVLSLLERMGGTVPADSPPRIEIRPDGYPMLTAVDSKDPVHMYSSMVGIGIPPDRLSILAFHYTIEEEYAELPETIEEIGVYREAVKSAEIWLRSNDLPDLPASPKKKRRWGLW